MPGRLTAIGRVVGGLGGLLVLVVGVPALLAVTVGWPLPRSLPTWEEVLSALSGSSVSDETILKTIAVVGWLAWMQVLVSTVVEAHAWMQGRVAASVPLAGPVQAVIRRLLLSALLVGGPVRAVSLATEPAPAPAVLVSDDAALAQCETPPAAPREGEPAPIPARPRTYTTQPRDSLWKLAERHLGDGLRWRDLWELNRGVSQPDGRSLRDPDLIRPGWLLRFPDDAVGLEAPAPAVENLAPAPAPPPQPPPERAPVSPPPAPVADAPDPPQPSAGHPRFSEESTDADGEPSGESPVPAPVGIAGAALLAAGLVATVTRLRGAQVRRRRPGQLIPIPEGERADAEAVIRAVASLDQAERLDIAMRALAERLASTDTPVPAIQAVLAGTDIEILFADPVVAEPGPFRVEAGGRAWTLPGTVDASRLSTGAGTSSPVPCLVPVGRIEDRDLLIDLEALPVTVLVGDSEEVDALLWSVAAALATSQWTDDLRVVALGEVAPGFERLERMEATTDCAAVERLLDDAAAMRDELADCGAVSTMQARLAGGSWTPTVLLVPTSTGSDEAQRVCDQATEGGGFTVVTAAEVDVAGRRLSVQHGVVSVTPPGIVAAVPEWPEGLRLAIGEIVDLAVPDEKRQGAPVIDVPQVAGGEVEDGPAADVGDLQGPLPPGALLLRTLGAVEIEGGPHVDRRKSMELVAYLALHPEGVDEQRLKTVLWPEGVPSGHAFNQLVSRTRIRLGTAPDGSRYLPRLQGGRYRLSEWFTTDAHRLEAAFRSARARPAPDTMERLADALRLVRGQPFQGVKAGYEWAHSEGFASRFEILVGEAAHLLAEWHLDHGEATAALWAADQGLLASPVDEALYRDRMRAYHLAGNAAAVDAVMRELCEVADAMEPYDSLHPETVELYERLTRRRVG